MSRRPDDVDEVAVTRAANGDGSIPLNRAEVAAVHALCEARGMSGNQIARLLGVTLRTVVRWRSGARPRSRKQVMA